MPKADGFKCELCGFVVTGEHAEKAFRIHVDVHQEREQTAAWRNRITAEDLVYLKVERIAYDGWIGEDD